MTLRIVFMGTPAFALPTLQALHDVHELVGVYCQAPEAAGRGMKLRKAAAHDWADVHGVPVFTPRSLRKQAAQDTLAALDADMFVVASYGLILPQAVLDMPRYGCVNIHPSLLPRWRGAAPLHRTVEAGDAETGVCIMRMDAGLDTGDVWARVTVPLPPRITTVQLHDMMAKLGADTLLQTLPRIVDGSLHATPQSNDGVTYAEKITKEEGRIDFNQPADMLDRKIRAFAPWPGTWLISHDTRLKVHAAEIGPATDAVPGTLLSDNGLVACGNGTSLQLQTLQREGKAATDAASFFRGFTAKVGDVL